MFSLLEKKKLEYTRGSKDKFIVNHIADPLLYQQDENNVVSITRVKFENEFGKYDIYSVSKFVKTGNCLAFVQMGTQANLPDAVENVRILASETNIYLR